MSAPTTAPAGEATPAKVSPPRSDVPRTLLALLASGLGAIPLCALFTDTGWLFTVWVSMLIAIGPAAIMRIWRPASAAQTWLGLILLVPWLTFGFLRSHAIAGVIPSSRTWHDITVLSRSLNHTTSTGVAPIHTTVAVRLVLCAVLALVAALIDFTAVIGRHGAIAGIPLLVTFTISGAVPRKPVSWVLFVAVAIAFLILLALDSRDDLYRWGHYIPRSGSVSGRATGLISAQRIAVVAVLIAVVAPAFVSADRGNLLSNLVHDGSSSNVGAGFGVGSGTGGITPFAALSGQLTKHKAVPLFSATVTGGAVPGSTTKVTPFYSRMNVLSAVDAKGWTTGAQGGSAPLDDGYPSSTGLPPAPDSVQFHAQITVKALTSNPPVFEQPTYVSGIPTSTAWDSQDQLLVGSTTHSGQKYDVTFEQPNPSIAELLAATDSTPSLAYWLKLPKIDPYVTSLVAEITKGDTTPYTKARALSNWFADPANHFQYSLSTKGGDSTDELVNFLQARKGFCQQYAAAMGIMLRVAGVPSRVVLGYTHAAPDSSGSFTVTTQDAHAWVEAFFSGVGWVPFDTTPLAGIAGGAQSDLPWAPHTGGNPTTSASPSITGSVHAPVPSNRPQPIVPTGTGVTATTAVHSGTDVAPVITGIIGVLVLALLATPWFARSRRRRSRLRRARHGDTDALWTELNDTATDLGYLWSDARSPRQVAAWLREPAGAAAGSLAILTERVELARYAPPASDRRTGDELAREFGEIDSALRSRLSVGERFRARVWPASLGWSARLRLAKPGRSRWHGRRSR